MILEYYFSVFFKYTVLCDFSPAFKYKIISVEVTIVHDHYSHCADLTNTRPFIQRILQTSIHTNILNTAIIKTFFQGKIFENIFQRQSSINYTIIFSKIKSFFKTYIYILNHELYESRYRNEQEIYF